MKISSVRGFEPYVAPLSTEHGGQKPLPTCRKVSEPKSVFVASVMNTPVSSRGNCVT